MIYAGYVIVAAGRSQTDRVKLSISASAGEVKFSLGKGKKIHQVGFHFVYYGRKRQLRVNVRKNQTTFEIGGKP